MENILNYRKYILGALAKYSYEYKEQQFQLSSGKYSSEYIDCRNMLSRATILSIVGNLFAEKIKREVQAIGGLTMGADSIAISTALEVSLELSYRYSDFKWFSIRKEIKEYGKQKLIEGAVISGEYVAIVDDVITSGKSIIQAIEKAQEFGLKIVQVLALVDREEDGIENVKEKYNIPVEALFNKSEIRSEWEKLNIIK